MLSLILTLSLALAPCSKTDNECLLNSLLQQTYDLEAARAQNLEYQKRIQDDNQAAGEKPKLFFGGMFAGIIFTGLGIAVLAYTVHNSK